MKGRREWRRKNGEGEKRIKKERGRKREEDEEEKRMKGIEENEWKNKGEKRMKERWLRRKEDDKGVSQMKQLSKKVQQPVRGLKYSNIPGLETPLKVEQANQI